MSFASLQFTVTFLSDTSWLRSSLGLPRVSKVAFHRFTLRPYHLSRSALHFQFSIALPSHIRYKVFYKGRNQILFPVWHWYVLVLHIAGVFQYGNLWIVMFFFYKYRFFQAGMWFANHIFVKRDWSEDHRRTDLVCNCMTSYISYVYVLVV